MRFIWKGFMTWIQKFHPSEQDLWEELTKDMDGFGSDVSPDKFEVLLTSSQCFNFILRTSALVMAQGLSTGCSTLNFWKSFGSHTHLTILPQLMLWFHGVLPTIVRIVHTISLGTWRTWLVYQCPIPNLEVNEYLEKSGLSV